MSPNAEGTCCHKYHYELNVNFVSELAIISTLAANRDLMLDAAAYSGTGYDFCRREQWRTRKNQLGGVVDKDPDFDTFVVIQSETDHLPLKAQWSLWALTALAELKPEFWRTEEWAKSFAPQACRNLIARFAAGQP